MRVKIAGVFVRIVYIGDMSHSSDLVRTVVKAIAEHEEVPPADLPPLEGSIDSENFKRLTETEVQLTEKLEFSYIWYRITIEADSVVAIDP